jgi:hypothetical protein
MTARTRTLLGSLLVVVAACSGGGPGNGGLDAGDDVTDAAAVDAALDAPDVVDYTTPTIPISELLVDTYKGFPGGLYPDRSNTPPPAHAMAGRAGAAAIRPRDTAGDPSPTGRYVLMSVGMSNTTQEWCSAGGAPPCTRQSLMAKAAANPMVDHERLAIVNGAAGGQVCTAWDEPRDPSWERVRGVLEGEGLSEGQVQVLWLKCAEARPTVPLPDAMAYAYDVERAIGGIARTAKARYPNLQLVFISNRIYAGYATTMLNPEPYAYETGLAVKWVIEAQIRQRATGTVDPIAGDLGPAVAPWLGWGPDLWANGTTPRADGLAYAPGDFENDGTHPGQIAEDKVSTLLLRFFSTVPIARCWFLAGQSCAMP